MTTNWQSQGVRVPGSKETLTEEQTAAVVSRVRAVASANTAAEIDAFTSGRRPTLSRPAQEEIKGLVQGYVS